MGKARDAAVSADWYVARDAAWNAARDAANSAAWNPAWNVAWDANLAIRAKDKITPEHFNILMHPWTSCDLSPFVEDWEAVLNPKVEEPKNFGAIVEYGGLTAFKERDGDWVITPSLDRTSWRLILEYDSNPIIISEGVEG